MTSPARARVPLGGTGIDISPIGLGCMGMSQFYGTADRAESVRTIHAAIDAGIDFFDTSDFYGAGANSPGEPPAGFGHNESLLAEAFGGRRDEVVLATKFSARKSADGETVFDGRPEYVAQACDASLRRLNTDRIDLYYYHRLDPQVPVEDTVGAMAGLVAAGKVRAIGLSAVDARVLRRAAAVAPIAALQSEYSLWERQIEDSVLPVCRELGITVVPYSPLGRAALTGTFDAGTTFAKDDFRATLPKFSSDHFAHNLRLIDELKAFSAERGFAPGQIALAWLLAQPHDIAPIPGTKRVKYVRENAAATAVPLSADDVALLSRHFTPARVRGGQYGELDVKPH
ncbi:aldo/keto reductase [Streptomyces sp. NPDC102274]|uniref:aldo/keto reductase n=1 Tax=Streptomyces sp. NPDC102274 TaxID=3366151 RepID=UPI003805F327